jgi:hypothetical protein
LHGRAIYVAAGEDAIAWAERRGEVAAAEETPAELRERFGGGDPRH